MGFGVWGLGYEDEGCEIWGLGVGGLGFGVWVWGFWFGVWNLGSEVSSEELGVGGDIPDPEFQGPGFGVQGVLCHSGREERTKSVTPHSSH